MFGVSFHRVVVYLPILFSLAAFGYDVWAIASGNGRCHEMGSKLSKWAALAAFVAVGTGFSLAGASGLGSGGEVTGHAGVGGLATIVLSGLVYTRYSAENRLDFHERPYSNVWLTISYNGRHSSTRDCVHRI